MSAATAEEESRSLETILGSREAVAEFFDSVWQKSCGVFPRKSNSSVVVAEVISENPHATSTTTALSSWNEDKALQNPYQELVENGWNVLISLLEEGERVHENETKSPNAHAALPQQQPMQELEKPLLFKNQNPLTVEEYEIHGGSLFSAFLDGCSIVMNHADVQSPWIAALCHDLQRSLPHAYANTYLTPPNCQTVPPHADDRDVFILQVYGAKQWTVYKNIPIAYPYPNEQVGKGQIPVPSSVLQGPVLIQQTLKAGDVLYMPRGYVHEAQSVADELSFHVTVALATHDWSLAGLILSTTEQVVKSSSSSSSCVDYRMALPRQFGRGTWDDDNGNDNDHSNSCVNDNFNSGMRISINDQQFLQQQIDQAINMVREKLTARAVHENLKIKFQRHNERARVGRLEIMARANQQRQYEQQKHVVPSSLLVVGLEASKRVNLHTRLRAATVQERQQAQAAACKTSQNQAVGLYVREDIATDIIGILQSLKSGSDGRCCRVRDLRSLMLSSPPSHSQNGSDMTSTPAARAINPLICDLTLLCFARKCVEFGSFAIVDQDDTIMDE